MVARETLLQPPCPPSTRLHSDHVHSACVSAPSEHTTRQVCVTTGSADALSKAFDALLGEGDALLVESARARRKSFATVRAPPRAELAGRAEVVSDIELMPALGERKDAAIEDLAGCGLLCGGGPPPGVVVSVEV